MDLTPLHGTPASAPHVPGFAARTLLGSGTHGEVWLADDLSTGGTVALKIGRFAPENRASASGDPPDRGPEHETAMLCRIDHPHIVRLQRVVPLPAGGLAMVLDLASGGSLASLVAARGRFDAGEVTTLLVPLADALDHLHRRGMVHGDIAPGNVLFTGDGRPQLGDLGAARVLGTRSGDPWATPGFTDPALTRSADDGIDLRAVDLWGLAAVGWFALTGAPPPTTTDGLSTDHAPALGELLMDCLSAAPADRPSLHELADRAWQAARPTPVRLGTRHGPDQANEEVAAFGLPPLSDRVTRQVPVTTGAAATAVPASVGASDAEEEVDHRVVGGSVAVPSDTDGPARPSSGGLGSDRLGSDRVGSDRLGSDRVVSGGRSDRIGMRWLEDERAGMSSASRESAAGRFRGTATRRAIGVVPLLAVGTAVLAVGAAAMAGYEVSTDVGHGPSPSSSSTSGRADAQGNDRVAVPSASLGSTESGTGQRSAPVTGLEAELTRALITIGRSRAAAFGRASAGLLAGADVTGSPAYLQDVRLVQRLRSQGYRLQGVRYEVSKVEVLRRRGELVDVRAVVKTSEHRQVRVGTGAAVPVPADGPRPVVLTVAPIDRNLPGAARWRVRDVQVPS